MITCPIHPREETSLASSIGTPALTSLVSMVRAQLPSTTVLEDELDVALSPGFCPGCDVDGNVALAFDSVFHVKHMPVNSDKAAVGQCSQPLYVSAKFGTVHVIVAFFLKVRVEVPGGRQGHGGDVSCGGSADRDGSKGRCRRTRRKADHAQFLGAVGVCETENVLARYGGDFCGGINARGGDGSGVYTSCSFNQ